VLYRLKATLEQWLSMDLTLEEKVIAQSTIAKDKENEQEIGFLEHEIECPRCHDSMMLCSNFDSLYYVCEECDFCLYTLKKN
jgi:late competence protein required for DNA uptake (superfamily II DNA/RNA helicase)